MLAFCLSLKLCTKYLSRLQRKKEGKNGGRKGGMGSIAVGVSYGLSLDRYSLPSAISPAIKMTIPFERARETEKGRGSCLPLFLGRSLQYK